MGAPCSLFHGDVPGRRRGEREHEGGDVRQRAPRKRARLLQLAREPRDFSPGHATRGERLDIGFGVYYIYIYLLYHISIYYIYS